MAGPFFNGAFFNGGFFSPLEPDVPVDIPTRTPDLPGGFVRGKSARQRKGTYHQNQQRRFIMLMGEAHGIT